MTPDARDYQQLRNGDPHGGVNCTAWAAAWLVGASGGKTTGTKVRAATDEPIPDPKSPGLNLPQVDAAVRKLTPFNFDTRLGDSTDDAEARIKDGRWAEIQVIRGVLVDHGMGGGHPFRGPHAITVHGRPEDGLPLIGDPLVPHYIAGTWNAIWTGASGIAGNGKVNAMFTRDLVPDYTVTIQPDPPHRRREFRVFAVKGGKVIRRDTDVTTGFTQPCTPPQHYPWPGHVGRSLVRILEGNHKGQYVRSQYAKET